MKCDQCGAEPMKESIVPYSLGAVMLRCPSCGSVRYLSGADFRAMRRLAEDPPVEAAQEDTTVPAVSTDAWEWVVNMGGSGAPVFPMIDLNHKPEERKAQWQFLVAEHPGLARLVDVPDAGDVAERTAREMRQAMEHVSNLDDALFAPLPMLPGASRDLPVVPVRSVPRCHWCGSYHVGEYPARDGNHYCEPCVAEMVAQDDSKRAKLTKPAATPTFPPSRRYARGTGDIGGGPEIG